MFGSANNPPEGPLPFAPIALGQVGIRCQHCRDISSVSPPNNADASDKNRHSVQNAISYPSFISGIYNTVQQMYRLHFEQ